MFGRKMYVVGIHPGPPLTVDPPKVLFARPAGVRGGAPIGGTFAISPDDQRFLMVRSVAQSQTDSTAVARLVIVQNFLEELKAKLRK